jgi:hypothetical protein
MATKKNPKTSSNTISPTLQKFFVSASVLAFAAQFIQSAYLSLMQYEHNLDNGGFIGFYFGVVLLTVLVLGLYMSKKHREISLKTIFDVSVMTVGVVLFGSALGWITSQFAIPPSNELGGMYWFFFVYQLLPLLITAPLLVIVIRRLRIAGQW